MPCLPIRHASTLTYGLYYRYQRANKAHEWKMRSKCEVCFNITGHYLATGAVTTLRHACFNGIQKRELVLKWYQRQFTAAAYCLIFFTNTYKLSHSLTLIMLTWRIRWAPNNASKWQIGFNSSFKGLIYIFGTFAKRRATASLLLSVRLFPWNLAVSSETVLMKFHVCDFHENDIFLFW